MCSFCHFSGTDRLRTTSCQHIWTQNFCERLIGNTNFFIRPRLCFKINFKRCSFLYEGLPCTLILIPCRGIQTRDLVFIHVDNLFLGLEYKLVSYKMYSVENPRKELSCFLAKKENHLIAKTNTGRTGDANNFGNLVKKTNAAPDEKISLIEFVKILLQRGKCTCLIIKRSWVWILRLFLSLTHSNSLSLTHSHTIRVIKRDTQRV